MGNETFGDRLRRMRGEKGMTQARLAEAAEVPLGTLRGWEQGQRHPLLDAALRLAEALGVTLDELAGRQAGPVAPPPPPAPPAPKKATPRRGKGGVS